MSCFSLTIGSVPRADRLPELQVGVSTRDDVRRTLGKPDGRGGVRITPELGQGELWVYQFATARPQLNMKIKQDVAILMVFFSTHLSDPDGRFESQEGFPLQEGRYVGHMWLSTLTSPDLGTAKAPR